MPERDGFELRISLQRLLTVLVLVIVPFSIVGLYLTHQSDRNLERTAGAHFETLAEALAVETAHFITDRVMDVGVMGVAPSVIGAVTAANHAYQNATDNAISAKFEQIQETWNSVQSDALVKQILSSPASLLLKRLRELDPRFLRITVTDVKGATVAATHKPASYFQGRSEQWSAVYAQGKGAANVTDVQYDAAAKAVYIAIGIPILDESSSRFVGAINALVDVSGLFTLLNGDKLGPTAAAVLTKDDGTVISAPNVTLSMKLKSEEYAAVHDAMSAVDGRETGYIVADMTSGQSKLIGFADTGLRRDYKNLGWIVMVSQDTREAWAPVHAIGRFALLMVVLSLLMLILLVVYFVLHRKQPFVDIEALHPNLPATHASQ